MPASLCSRSDRGNSEEVCLPQEVIRGEGEGKVAGQHSPLSSLLTNFIYKRRIIFLIRRRLGRDSNHRARVSVSCLICHYKLLTRLPRLTFSQQSNQGTEEDVFCNCYNRPPLRVCTSIGTQYCPGMWLVFLYGNYNNKVDIHLQQGQQQKLSTTSSLLRVLLVCYLVHFGKQVNPPASLPTLTSAISNQQK